jgi:4'-phosphopantetheinyl transferase
MTVWEPSPPQASLGANRVDLWRVALNVEPACQAALGDLLSSQETQQACRFQFERDRRRYLVAHAALRTILSRYLGCDPHAVHYQVSSYGKPSLKGHAGLHFNLAHSHELALIAVTALGEIGVDVEHIRALDGIDQLARVCFSEQEYQQFHALPNLEGQHAFFHCWARKEAYIKALGEGLSHPLQQFSVALLPTQSARMLSIDGSSEEAAQWTLQSVDLGAEYTAAFAVRATSVTTQCWNLHFNSELAHVSC